MSTDLKDVEVNVGENGKPNSQEGRLEPPSQSMFFWVFVTGYVYGGFQFFLDSAVIGCDDRVIYGILI